MGAPIMRGLCAIVLAVWFAGFWLHDHTVVVALSVSETGNSPRDVQSK